MATVASNGDELYATASAMDIALGDPADEANPVGFHALVARDTTEAFPVKLASKVAPELALCFVPAAEGGRLSTVDESIMLVRVAARRDVTVVPATMVSVTAATCVLLAGSTAQRQYVLKLLADGSPVGFALTEAEHGCDVMANTCALTSSDGALRLSGEKWLVGLGGRCEAALVIARTGNIRRGPATFSAVLVDGEALAAARTAAGQRLTGMRGIDFAGLRFDGAEFGRAAVVGQPGRGMDTAMLAMQVVRAYTAAASLGSADTGLRLTMDFARQHRVAGKIAAGYPAVRRELATAAATLFGCDAVALATARLLHTHPEQASLTTSVAKTVIADGTVDVFGRCADLLGARSLLHEGRYAAFDVMRRDNSVVRFVDTSPAANLRQLGSQLARWASDFDPLPNRGKVTDALAAAFDLDADLPQLRLSGLEPSARGRDAVTAAVPYVVGAARAALGDGPTPDSQAQVERAVLRLSAVEMALVGLRRKVLRARQRLGAAFAGSLEQLDLTERFCRLHAAASCALLWWFNRDRPLFGAEPGSTGWLSAALLVLLDRADGFGGRLDAADTEAAFTVLGRLHGQGYLFSAAALPLAEAVNRRPTTVLD